MDDEIDRETFGPLVDITEESLILLASNIRKEVLHETTSVSKHVARTAGSYNIVHIIQLDDLKLVIRIPATGWGVGKNDTAARALESQVATMRLITKKTTIPVPQVYHYDTSDNNPIGAPYICMSFVPGTTVSRVWFKDPDTTSREELRLKILKSVARVMGQFSCFTFDKIGSIVDDETTTPLAPCYDWQENFDGSIQVVSSGPFDTASDFVQAHFKPSSEESEWDKAESIMLQSMMPSSAINESSGGFVLLPPDFDSQNVMVDEQGNVTGLIDWDLVQTMPRSMGYARYPSWITRDWDPLMYGWPKMDTEDSPETLERYRAYYNGELGKELNEEGDWQFTKKSHITEAVWIAAFGSHNRLEICRKFVRVALDVDADQALSVMYDIGTDYYDDKDWNVLETKLKRMVSLKSD
ncbi:kinase-like domain-containing protein [Hypomontagnella monticulosa]|nr:kinase-like domain-containing protein [Hypomontagnella monticulosa]